MQGVGLYYCPLLLTPGGISVTSLSRVIGTSSRFIHNATGTNTPNSVISAIKYENADVYKLKAVKENKKKSGVYRWVNKVNGKSYVGSSVNLGIRFKDYYDFSHLSKNNMTICKALLKYGYSNFSLEILEYCDRDKVINREQGGKMAKLVWPFFRLILIY